jgi:hypothetical protein
LHDRLDERDIADLITADYDGTTVASLTATPRPSLLAQSFVASESLDVPCVHTLKYVGDNCAHQRHHDGNHIREQTLHAQIVCRRTKSQ